MRESDHLHMFFSFINVLLKDKIFDIKVFTDSFEYHVNSLENKVVELQDKLIDREEELVLLGEKIYKTEESNSEMRATIANLKTMCVGAGLIEPNTTEYIEATTEETKDE
jgi:hypothetical protein